MALSKHPAKRSKQLSNLTPPTPAPPANRRAVKHGGKAQHPKRQAQLERQIRDALPVRDKDGGPPAHDAIAVSLLALTLARLESCARYTTKHGMFTRAGKVHPSVAVEDKLIVRTQSLCAELGMSPRARASLGLTLKQAEALDLATLMSDATEARRAPHADIDGTANDA